MADAADGDVAGRAAAELLAQPQSTAAQLDEALGAVLRGGPAAVDAFQKHFGSIRLLRRLAVDARWADESDVADAVLAACTVEGERADRARGFASQTVEQLHHDELYPDRVYTLRAPLGSQPAAEAVRAANEDASAAPMALRIAPGASFVPAHAAVLWDVADAAPEPREATLTLRELSRRARIGAEIELKVWPSSAMLAHWLYCHAPLVRGRDVLELGSGVGLAGLAAARAGARSVFVTDINGTALRVARENARANLLMAGEGEGDRPVHVAHLDWGAPPIVEGDDDGAEEARLRSRFELIIAADVVNAEGLPELLVHVVRLYLEPDGLFVMICPKPRHRHMVDVLLARLKEEEAGLRVSSARTPPWLEAALDAQAADEARDVEHELHIVQRR